MALHIYIGKENLPEDKEFILDNENYFAFSGITDCDFSRYVIKEIEQGEFINTMFFRDRFGGQLYIDCLSTGSKTLLNIYNNEDKVFYGGEMGDNALELLSILRNGNIYFDNMRSNDLLGIPFQKGIYVNNIFCADYDAVEEVLV